MCAGCTAGRSMYKGFVDMSLPEGDNVKRRLRPKFAFWAASIIIGFYLALAILGVLAAQVAFVAHLVFPVLFFWKVAEDRKKLRTWPLVNAAVLSITRGEPKLLGTLMHVEVQYQFERSTYKSSVDIFGEIDLTARPMVEVLVDPSDPKILYAANGSLLYRIVDDGQTEIDGEMKGA